MSNQITLKSGNGINLIGNASNKEITIASTITEEQLLKLSGGPNGFITRTEVETLIANSSGGSAGGTPAGFPKLILISSTFTIPANGRYRISMVGGGGGGSTGWVGDFVNDNSFISGNDGSDTKVTIGGQTIIAKGGHGGQPNGGGISTIPYDGTKGALSGGGKGQMGGTGAGPGGTATSYSGGGGGSPLNYNTHMIYAKQPYCSTGESSSNGYGYGAGGGGIHGNNNKNGGGGSSGYLVVHEQIFTQNTQLTFIIGAGGKEVYRGQQPYHSGAGADGAAVIEWLGNS